MRRGRQEEVDRVFGAVVERRPRGLRRDAFVLVGGLPEGVRLPLPLRIEGQHHVARLGQRLGGVPVHVLVGLDRAVRDHDPGSLRRPGGRRPHVARDRGAVAGGEQDRADNAVAVLRPVVQADVAGAAVREVPAQIVGEEPPRIRGLGGERLSGAGGAFGRELGLILRGVIDRLALLGDREVLRLDDRVERRRRVRGRRCDVGSDDGEHRDHAYRESFPCHSRCRSCAPTAWPKRPHAPCWRDTTEAADPLPAAPIFVLPVH